jgi:hypothetical protein
MKLINLLTLVAASSALKLKARQGEGSDISSLPNEGPQFSWSTHEKSLAYY